MKAGYLCFHQLQVKNWDAALNGWDSYVDVVVFRSLGAVRVDGGGGGVSGGAGGGGLNVMCNENELGPNSLFLGHYVAI